MNLLCNFTVVNEIHPQESSDQGILFLKDLDGKKSITNDAENVLRWRDTTFPNYRIKYQDSYGHWAEIQWNNNKTYALFTIL